MEREDKTDSAVRRTVEDGQAAQRSAWTAIASQVANGGMEVAKGVAVAATTVWTTKKLSEQSKKKDGS